jgi:phosphoenolpyruvate synthase/pyruvate phosphate dikinase
MDQKQKDQGIILVLLERFNKHRHPRALALKQKVDSGELLNDFDHQLIKEVQEDGKKVRALIERNPEYKDLAAEIMNLWNEIIEKDLENHKKQNK